MTPRNGRNYATGYPPPSILAAAAAETYRGVIHPPHPTPSILAAAETPNPHSKKKFARASRRKNTQFLARSSSWQGPFFFSNLFAQKRHKVSYVPVPGRGLFFLSDLSGQKGHKLSYVSVPGRGLFFSATYQGKKDINCRTFQFLAGAFFSQQLIWAKRA